MRPMLLYLTGITWAIYSYSNVFFLFAPYLALMEFSSESAGILVGAFYAATSLIRPASGWIIERSGIRRTLVVSALLCLGAAFFKFVTASFWPLLLIRLAMGGAYGVFVVALTTYQALVVPDEARGAAFAIVTLGSLSCLFTVVPLADWLLRRRLPALFLTIPLCTAALCVILSCRLPPLPAGSGKDSGKEGKTETDWGTWGELYRDTPFWRILTSCALFGLCDASIVSLPALILAKGLKTTSFVVASGLGALTMRTLGRNFFNRYPRYVFAGPSLTVMAFFLYLTASAASEFQLAACGLFYGVGMGYGFPAHLALVGDLAPARLRAKSSALVHFCYDASWFVLPVYVGFATSRLGTMGASFELLALACVGFGAGVTAMWTAYARAKNTKKPDK
jgi:predicted MFS family arabinose efflux permease